MAIVNNTATEIGDEILIQAVTPIYGVIQLESFNDLVEGETLQRYFKKEFSYSIDGIFFSDWIPLTDEDLKQVVVNQTQSFYIHYKYTRVGSDTNGVLIFHKVCVEGQFTAPTCQNYFILPNSIYKDFFCNNPQHSLLCSILTNKMFEKGILPDYIIRNQTDNPQEDDRDFLDFWGTVCCFFALQLMLAKKIENFDSFLDSLQDFLEQRDIIFCKNMSELEDLQYIKANYHDEIRQRGTYNVFNKKSVNKKVHGEFLRLICYKDFCDEFFWNLINDQEIGWWLGKSSPMYKGTVFSTELIKGVEKTKDFLSLSNFDIFSTNSNSVKLVFESNKNITRISNVPNGEIAGFSVNLDSQKPNIDKSIIIDSNVDYEITFWIKQNINVDNISFGFMGYDCDGNEVFPRKLTDGSISNFFFQKKKLNKTNFWYFIRGVIYNKNQYQLSENQARLDIGFGEHLKSFGNMERIIPYVVQDRENNPDSFGSLDIWDLKVRPLVRGAVANTVYNDSSIIPNKNNEVSFGSFSTCFLTTSNILHVTYKNSNKQKTNEDIFKIARQKLIPYNSSLVLTELTPKTPPTVLILNEFDYLILRYRWFNYSGSDLDTRTCIFGTIDNLIDNKYVGWSRGDILGGKRYIGDINDPYIIWGGDETNSFGEEQILINFKKLVDDKPLIIDFFVKLRAFWYGSKNTGEVQIEFETFLGGSMNSVGLGFENVGGQSVDLVTHETIVNLIKSNSSLPAEQIDGDELGVIKYNKLTKQAVLNPA